MECIITRYNYETVVKFIEKFQIDVGRFDILSYIENKIILKKNKLPELHTSRIHNNIVGNIDEITKSVTSNYIGITEKYYGNICDIQKLIEYELGATESSYTKNSMKSETTLAAKEEVIVTLNDKIENLTKMREYLIKNKLVESKTVLKTVPNITSIKYTKDIKLYELYFVQFEKLNLKQVHQEKAIEIFIAILNGDIETVKRWFLELDLKTYHPFFTSANTSMNIIDMAIAHKQPDILRIIMDNIIDIYETNPSCDDLLTIVEKTIVKKTPVKKYKRIEEKITDIRKIINVLLDRFYITYALLCKSDECIMILLNYKQSYINTYMKSNLGNIIENIVKHGNNKILYKFVEYVIDTNLLTEFSRDNFKKSLLKNLIDEKMYTVLSILSIKYRDLDIKEESIINAYLEISNDEISDENKGKLSYLIGEYGIKRESFLKYKKHINMNMWKTNVTMGFYPYPQQVESLIHQYHNDLGELIGYCTNNDPDYIKELLSYKNDKGQTLLMISIKNRNLVMAKILLSFKPDEFVTDKFGNTILHYAMLYTAVLILDSIKMHAKENNFGMTPQDYIVNCIKVLFYHSKNKKILDTNSLVREECKPYLVKIYNDYILNKKYEREYISYEKSKENILMILNDIGRNTTIPPKLML